MYRILIVSQYFWPENFKINDIACALKEKGYHVEILTGKPNYPTGIFFNGYSFWCKNVEYWNGIKIHRTPLISRSKGRGLHLFLNYISFAIFGSIRILFIKNKFDKIIVFDTEQSIYDFSRQVKHLKYLIKAEKIPVNLEAYLFRQYDPEVILNSIYLIMLEKKPKIIFIDNITELVLNFNDPVESKKLVQFLKKITAEFNCTIITLLHLGKGNLQSLGNLGSMTDRSSNSVLRVIYDKETQSSTLEANMLRSDSLFKPITIIWSEEEKTYIQINLLDQAPTEKISRKFDITNLSREDHFTKLSLVFGRKDQLTYEELISEIKLIYGVGTNIAKQIIVPVLLEQYILSRIEKGIYILLTPKKNKYV